MKDFISYGTKIQWTSRQTNDATDCVKLYGFIAEVTYFLEEELQPPKQQGKVFSAPPMFPWNLSEVEARLPSHGDREMFA